MDAKLCDCCKSVITDPEAKEFVITPIGTKGSVTLKLDDQDWCSECARKERARIFRAAWDSQKATRKTKE